METSECFLPACPSLEGPPLPIDLCSDPEAKETQGLKNDDEDHDQAVYDIPYIGKATETEPAL
jgi:hypothetical protein